MIEAVPENIELKVEIFAALDRSRRPHAILASNTSSLSITEMAAATSRPQQVVGMHFFNPVHRMKLLEIVRALETSDATIAACVPVGEKMGKECVVGARVARVRHQPHQRDDRQRGVLHAAGGRGQRAATSTRRSSSGSTTRWGRSSWWTWSGLDTRLSILRFLHRTLGEKFRPCPLMEQYVAAGRLGRKVGTRRLRVPAELSAGARYPHLGISVDVAEFSRCD